ncbi:MAG: ammonia-forming cytochrome c nitrite reductase subunit c552 [Candidatus Thorarchaeota archaeon]
MVYYKEVPEVNKRMVAGYYLFLCLIGFAILLGPTGSGIPITLIGTSDRDTHEAILANPNPDGDISDAAYGCGDDGAGCHAHPDRYGNWSMSYHARAAVWNGTHVLIGNLSSRAYTQAFFNSSCAACHTTGYNETDNSFDAYGVNCFACHNVSAAEWVAYDGAPCLTCHTGDPNGDHPYQGGFWSTSAHAMSLEDLRASGHASESCMHCMTAEGSIFGTNPDELATTSPDVDETFSDVEGNYNSISCPACHAVHSNWTAAYEATKGGDDVVAPGYIRAANATELCGLCHIEFRHPMYEVFKGGPHDLAGVECTSCHGYSLTRASGTPFLNHSFALNLTAACGQSETCHMDTEDWALGQLEMIQDAFEALSDEFYTEADALRATILAYNDTAGADTDLVDDLILEIDNAEYVFDLLGYDRSEGFHNPAGVFEELNAAYRDLLEAKATFYESVPEEVTVTVTVTVTQTAPPPIPGDTLFLIGGSVAGIVIGLVLGILVGRRR